MSEAIPWKLLQDQYFSDSSYEDEIAKLVHSPEDVRCCCLPCFQALLIHKVLSILNSFSRYSAVEATSFPVLL